MNDTDQVVGAPQISHPRDPDHTTEHAAQKARRAPFVHERFELSIDAALNSSGSQSTVEGGGISRRIWSDFDQPAAYSHSNPRLKCGPIRNCRRSARLNASQWRSTRSNASQQHDGRVGRRCIWTSASEQQRRFALSCAKAGAVTKASASASARRATDYSNLWSLI